MVSMKARAGQNEPDTNSTICVLPLYEILRRGKAKLQRKKLEQWLPVGQPAREEGAGWEGVGGGLSGVPEMLTAWTGA